MNDEQLKQTLRAGEAGYELPSLRPRRLIERVHALDRRRNSRRNRIAACAACIVLAAGAWQLLRTSDQVHAPSVAIDRVGKPITKDIDRELARIDSELRVLRRAVAILDRGPPAPATDPLALPMSLEDLVQIESDVVAEGILRRADASNSDMPMELADAAVLERVIELFPESRPAAIARERLEQLRN
jgi:hypothetical protein